MNIRFALPIRVRNQVVQSEEWVSWGLMVMAAILLAMMAGYNAGVQIGYAIVEEGDMDWNRLVIGAVVLCVLALAYIGWRAVNGLLKR